MGLGDPGPEVFEAANLVQLGRAVAELAARREESRGGHWRSDHPAPVEAWRVRQTLARTADGGLEAGLLAVPEDGGGPATVTVPATRGGGAVTITLPAGALTLAVRTALDEDLGAEGDPTSRLLGARAGALLVAREPGVIAGLPAVDEVLAEVRQRLRLGPAAFRPEVADSAPVEAGAVIGHFAGPARVLLAAERTMLNLLGHLSGVATLTAAFVEAVAGTGAVVRDTRKTTPGLRYLEKYAVRCGGGANHRMGLYDALLVKDNHIQAAGSLRRAVEAARAAGPGLPLEVEVETLEQVAEALDLGCDLLLLDNMELETMAEAVKACGRRARTEASGGITLERARAVAGTGVDFLAVGAITHSAPSLDIALDWEGG